MLISVSVVCACVCVSLCVQATRANATLSVFINGALVGSTTLPSGYTLGASTRPMQIANQEGSSTFTGFLSNVRLVVGTALYKTSFTPPNSPLTPVPGTALLALQRQSAPLADASSNGFSGTQTGGLLSAMQPFGECVERHSSLSARERMLGGCRGVEGGSETYEEEGQHRETGDASRAVSRAHCVVLTSKGSVRSDL